MCLRTFTFVWTFFSLGAIVLCQTCDVTDYVTRDTVLEHHVFSRFRTKDVLECAQSCIKRRQCQSINFGTKLRMCELNDRKYESEQARTYAYEHVYSERSSWPSQLDPACFKRPCNEDQVCVPGYLAGNSDCSYSCLNLAPGLTAAVSPTTPSSTATMFSTATPPSTVEDAGVQCTKAGQSFPHTDPTKYYICESKGRAVDMKCAIGTVWDQARGICNNSRR